MRRLIVLAALVAAGAWLAAARLDSSARAGTALRLDVADMAATADLILEGRVLDAAVLEGETGLIETEYLVTVDRTLWGADLGSRVVRLPGGVLPDGRGMMIPGMPRISVGEDVLLFLSKATTWGMRMPMGLSQGKFRVVHGFDGSRRLVRDAIPVTYLDAASGTLTEASSAASLDYSAVISEIHAGIAERRALHVPAPAVGEGEED